MLPLKPISMAVYTLYARGCWNGVGKALILGDGAGWGDKIIAQGMNTF